jgi:hypothetical protein
VFFLLGSWILIDGFGFLPLMANFQLDRLMKLSLTILPASSPFSPKIWNCINGHKLQYRLKFVCLFFFFFFFFFFWEDCSEPTASQSEVQHCHSTHVDSFFFFFFLTCPHKGSGRGIRTCDLHFIRRSLQPIELPLGTDNF